MPRTRKEKKKGKRKIKQKERRQMPTRALHREKIEFLFEEAQWHNEKGQFKEGLWCLEKILRLDPGNEECLRELCYLGYLMKRREIEVNGLLGLYEHGYIKFDEIPLLFQLLDDEGRHKQALEVIKGFLKDMPVCQPKEMKALKEFLEIKRNHCQIQLEIKKKLAAKDTSSKGDGNENSRKKPKENSFYQKADSSQSITKEDSIPKIPITIQIDSGAFKETLADKNLASMEDYQLAIEGHRIRFKETFESLICLNSLKNIRSFWFQEETARKILKNFRGRALLADEVGLGKTIEALMVLKEYVQRGMVKSALILTPTPLVSQWREELKNKFDLDFPSTDDPGFQSRHKSFWKQDFILASINIAKSKKNFPAVTKREYDMVIVDEAHHLKNRNTLNWKLVNALKKRFLLLITATPVENNLMELYNIITLLKPGQLKTASAFRKEFMTRGEPTDPRNRSRLKDLLGQVMIRNTRAFAKIDIPPRFAQTINVGTGPSELELYKEVSAFIKELGKNDGPGRKLMLKNLLAEAGSSPRALSLTFSRMFEERDLPSKHKKWLYDINELCASLSITSKDRMLLKLLNSCPGKMIIFVKYHGTLNHVSEFLAKRGIRHSLFHGSMDNRSKDEQIQNFKEEKDILLTTEIGGEGRNLQFCHQMLNYDLPWNPMKIEQRIGRIHRIGQENEVMIYNLCAGGSVEDYILEILDKKINMFEMVIGEIDMILGRLEKEKDFSDVVYEIWMDSNSEQETKKAFEKLGTKLKKVKNGYQKSKELDQKLFGENYEI
ncbi:MAG: DEAD/DEAH box helicase [Actinomycetota bacterium]